MEQFFKKAITDKLPTFEHYKQLCYTLSVRETPPYNTLDIFAIDTMATIKDIQTYMFNILSQHGTIVGIIEYVEKFKFYIAPNTYTDKLTLKQFFHCIDIKYNGYYIDTCKYKYNIFYKGEKFDNVHDYHNYLIINKQFISCYHIGLTEGVGDNNFKNLPIEHFTTLLKIMGNEYVDGDASYANDYICKYWEDKDIELYLEYAVKNRHCLENCLEKNIIKNNYTQEKLLPLYEKYLRYNNLTVRTDPLCYCYTNITKILKKYIKFPTVRLGFDTKVDIAPSTVAIAVSSVQPKKAEPDGYRKIQLIIDAANEELFKKLFEKDYKSIKDTETIIDAEVIKKTTDGYKKIQSMLTTANEKLFEKIQIELTKNEEVNIKLQKKCDVYAMTCDDLTMANAELQEANAELQEANEVLKERTKILDESNF
jgi:hypothetical protein